MLARIWILAVMLLLIAASPAAASDAETMAVDRLVHDFVEAFNSGDHDVLAAFYEDAASASFRERRTEQESRELHENLFEMLGELSVRQIDVQSAEEVSLSAGMKTPGAAAQFRFRLVGDPPRIDGFSVGVDPSGGEGSGHSADAAPKGDHDDPFEFLTSREGVHQSQLLVQSNGELLLVWVHEGPFDFDLFVARQGSDGKFSHPMRINRRGVNAYTGDEARPSVALGPDGAVAIAWTAANHDIMLAVGEKFGESFGTPLKLNQDQGKAFRTMPSTAFSADGAVHTIWLDPREAPAGREEPSDLYYASVKNGRVSESNLTARQEPTVCGCCRPFINIDGKGQFDIAFRNSTSDGYRDISRISGESGALSEPQPTSRPVWKLGGCPMAGPVYSNGGTLWKDASTGSWRLLWSTGTDADPAVVLSDSEELVLTYSPRFVSGREAWVLLGAKPHGLIVTWKEDGWQVVRDDLPPWASSATLSDGRLILIGNKDGRLRMSTQEL